MSFNGQYLGTTGIEVEGVGLSRDYVLDYLNGKMREPIGKRRLMVARDASTEYYADLVRLGKQVVKISEHTAAARQMNFFQNARTTMGYEIITAPMEIGELQRTIFQLLPLLESAGDFVSPRAATHFHIGFANNLRILKNLLRVCLALDPVLYRLGGMGGTFRGHVNLSAYARPLLNSACVPIVDKKKMSLAEMANAANWATNPEPPMEESHEDDDEEHDDNQEEMEQFLEELQEEQTIPPVKESPYITGKFAQCINPMQALEACTIEGFWSAFGINYTGEMDKYHPSRYSGINFFAIPAHGTIEFRHFNQSFDPVLVMAIAKFLRATVETVTLLDKREVFSFEPVNPNVQISVDEGVSIMERLLSLARAKEVENLPSSLEMDILCEVLAESSFQPIPEMPVLTHKSHARISSEGVEAGKLRLFDKVLTPDYVDIHNIGGRELRIFSD